MRWAPTEEMPSKEPQCFHVENSHWSSFFPIIICFRLYIYSIYLMDNSIENHQRCTIDQAGGGIRPLLPFKNMWFSKIKINHHFDKPLRDCVRLERRVCKITWTNFNEPRVMNVCVSVFKDTYKLPLGYICCRGWLFETIAILRANTFRAFDEHSHNFHNIYH